MNVADLERIYDLLADTIDAVPEDKVRLFLAKFALLAAHALDDARQVTALIENARTDL
ncbi:hypothetical protein [Tepidiphilus succinatimandens]|jgi:hypothetical protein|uniref:hypothetical protein n=1 Tax=Tepidiphilus succinatimandens TaxID=224436 RepID=UPI0014777DB1|nr:hypothetical protein [Tepidiphilus succinatimandens]